VCAGAQGPLEHSHFFTDDNAFGSHDEHGEEVDHGDYELVDEGTLAFPSHASEFGYDGDLVVDYEIDGDIVTFDVALPESSMRAPMPTRGRCPLSPRGHGPAAVRMWAASCSGERRAAKSSRRKKSTSGW
jgi:hypothetical protein